MSIQMSKELFESIETVVEQSLKPQGYRKSKHQHQSQIHGGMYSVFESAGGLTRLIWDAKVRWLIVRVYGKRTWFMRLAKALIGRNDDEKLVKELIIKHDEFSTLSEEQVVRNIIQTVKQ